MTHLENLNLDSISLPVNRRSAKTTGVTLIPGFYIIIYSGVTKIILFFYLVNNLMYINSYVSSGLKVYLIQISTCSQSGHVNRCFCSR